MSSVPIMDQCYTSHQRCSIDLSFPHSLVRFAFTRGQSAVILARLCPCLPRDQVACCCLAQRVVMLLMHFLPSAGLPEMLLVLSGTMLSLMTYPEAVYVTVKT